jgi:prepilin-type N-terminal cleavage/methylation domain-containing protein/prepilin-type processing-associated H-X9-DG protein
MVRRLNRTLGFTLLELLVVVAVIGMLIAILLPTLRRARAQAREVKCATQLREYARGFHYYLQEYNDVFPLADYGFQSDTDYVQPPTWFQLIERYWWGDLIADHEQAQKTGELYPLGRCPELGDIQQTNEMEWQWKYSFRAFGYGYNRWWLGWNDFERGLLIPEQTFWRRFETVKRPAECLLVGDSGVRVLGMHPDVGPIGHYLGWAAIAKHGAGVDTRHGAGSVEPTVPSRYGGYTAYYRDGRGNIAWVDGHVTARTSKQINEKARWRHLWDPGQGIMPK